MNLNAYNSYNPNIEQIKEDFKIIKYLCPNTGIL